MWSTLASIARKQRKSKEHIDVNDGRNDRTHPLAINWIHPIYSNDLQDHYAYHICRLKAYNYCIDFLVQKINDSGISPAKTQPIRTKFGIRGEVKKWQRSRNLGRDRPILAKMGAWDESRGARVFLFGKLRDLSGTSQRPIFIKFGHET